VVGLVLDRGDVAGRGGEGAVEVSLVEPVDVGHALRKAAQHTGGVLVRAALRRAVLVNEAERDADRDCERSMGGKFLAAVSQERWRIWTVIDANLS
jgi:hypothetical protein